MSKSYNFNLITSNRSYSVVQICKIYKNKKLHEQTIRSWIKKEGLKVICKKPIMIYGATLKEFLKTRNEKNKKSCAFDEFNCFHCKELAKPLEGKITIITKQNKSLKAIGKCPSCDKEFSKFYKANDMEALKSIFLIQNPVVVALCNTSVSRQGTHINQIEVMPLNKPSKNSSASKQNTHIENQLTLL